jgi:hypothetical protein
MNRQISDDESGGFGTGNGFDMVKHMRQSDMGGVRKTENDHAQRIADEEDVRAGLVEQACHGKVIAGQRGNGAGAFSDR